MLGFALRRLGVMALTMACLSLAVFFLVHLEPNLRKLSIGQTNIRADEATIESWLVENGYRQPFVEKYAEWLGLWPKDPATGPDGAPTARFAFCDEAATPVFSGVLQGDFGCSTSFRAPVADRLWPALANTGVLMFWVMAVMIPSALAVGVLAGMREGSRLDRGLSAFAITSTSTPEYISGVLFTALFVTGLKSWVGDDVTLLGLHFERFYLNASAASATRPNGDGVTFYNFALPVMTMALYGLGYVARMTRASMAEVMTAQYIRTARLKGLSFRAVVLRHALRNALIAPFTVIMLQFPWLLTGVVIVETMFRYQGFGWLLVEAAGNNDIDLLLACSLISVLIVLATQLVSDLGYAALNPRIRVR